MFSSSRITHGKRGRRSGSRRASTSSRVSLFSGITTASGGSNGSDSTVTQESVSRSTSNKHDEKVLVRPKKQKASTNLPFPQSRRSSGSSASSDPEIDVFSFLDGGHPEKCMAEPDGALLLRDQRSASMPLVPEESDGDGMGNSLHSDSGISISDLSPESAWRHRHPHPTPKVWYKTTSHQPMWLPTTAPLLQADNLVSDALRHEGPPMVGSHKNVEPYGHGCPDDLDTARTVSSKPGHSSQKQRGKPLATAGYELLAAQLSLTETSQKPPLTPLYRRFSKLNHRILLQLQDEIAQMEDDLARLDRAAARLRRAPDGVTVPESRRVDWQWCGSEIHSHRLDLLGQIYVKVEQYSKLFCSRLVHVQALEVDGVSDQALISFQTLLGKFSRAPTPDVTTYRSWMSLHRPIASIEAGFLEHVDDLVTLAPKQLSSAESFFVSRNSIITIIIGSQLPIILILLFCFPIRAGTFWLLLFVTLALLGLLAYRCQDSGLMANVERIRARFRGRWERSA